MRVAETVEELKQEIRGVLAETGVPGAGVALVSEKRVRWVEGIGLADIATNRAVTADTLFRVGSVSKSFVALAVLKLVEEGRIRLSDRLRDLAPEIELVNPWAGTDPVRLVHLLEHTAGFDDLHLREYAWSDPSPTSLRQGLAYHPHSRRVRWRPGTFSSYSNSGPAVAAYVVEKITGHTFEAFVRQELFEPLGMETATYFPASALAKGYRGDGVSEVPYWHLIMRPSGALNASPRELARFVQMLLGRGTLRGVRLLRAESIRRLERPTTTLAAKAGLRAGYGLGVRVVPHDGFAFWGHQGGMRGYLASFGYLPDEELAYVLMINSGNPEAFDRLEALLRDYLVRGLERPAAPAASLAVGRLERWGGSYRHLTPRQELVRFVDRLLGVVRVRLEGPHLTARPIVGEPKVLVPVAEGSFRGEDEPLATTVFLQRGGEEVLLQGFGTVVQGTYRRVARLQIWAEWTVAAAAVGLMSSSVVFALGWVPRKLFGRMREASYLRVRVVPLVSVLALVAAVATLIAPGEGFIDAFGRPSLWSLGFCVLTWLFALSAVAALVISVWAWRWPIRRAVRVHSLLVSAANVTVAGYLAYWGIIGLRMWLY